MTDAMFLVGNGLIGALFVIAGIRHGLMFSTVSRRLAARVPAPTLVLAAGSVFEVLAGAALAAQLLMPYAAWGLIVFTAAATLIALDFWAMPHGVEREGVMNAALSNVAIIGGLMVDAAHFSA